MEVFSQLCYTVAVITDIHTGNIRLSTELFILKKNVNAMYEYVRVFGYHLFNPFIVSLDELRTILVHEKQGMKANQRLKLHEDPNGNILAYSSVVRKTSIINDAFLLLTLMMSLIDKCL